MVQHRLKTQLSTKYVAYIFMRNPCVGLDAHCIRLHRQILIFNLTVLCCFAFDATTEPNTNHVATVTLYCRKAYF